MLEKIIEICPESLWNKKVSGFVFWQQLLHTFSGIYCWLREEKLEIMPPLMFSIFNGKKIYAEFERDPEIDLSKNDIRKLCDETKVTAEKWFKEKDDIWLKKILFGKLTNFDNTMGQIKHIMYHIGHCEAILREYEIETEEYLDYWGE
jgi:hypothetical protein